MNNLLNAIFVFLLMLGSVSKANCSLFAQATDSTIRQKGVDLMSATAGVVIAENLINAEQYDIAKTRVLENLRAFNQHLKVKGIPVATSYQQLGKIFYYQGNYRESLAAFDSCLAIYTRNRGADNRFNFEIYDHLGTLHLALGDYESALFHLRKSITLNPLENHDKASVYRHLAHVWLARDLYDSTLYYYNKALPIYIATRGESGAEVALTYSELGSVYTEMGDFSKALLYLDHAEDIYSKLKVQPTHNQIVNHLYKGRLYWQMGALDQALQLTSTALNMVLNNPQSMRTALGECYNQIALIWHHKGDHRKAIDFFELALINFYHKYKGDHPHIATVYDNMGNSYARLGLQDEAIAKYAYSYKVFYQSFGADHLKLIYPLNNMALAYAAKGDFPKAQTNYEQALKIVRKNLGENHPNTLRIKSNLGEFYNIIGNYPESIKYHLDALNVSPSQSNPDLGFNYYSLAKSYGKLQQYPQAEAAFQKAWQALNYQPGNLKACNSLTTLIDGLKEAALFYQDWYQQQHKLEHLRLARRYAQESLLAINELATGFSADSKTNLADRSHTVYALATKINLTLYDQTDSLYYRQQAFDFAERSKSILLLSAMQEQEALKVPGIPTELLLEEHNLRIDLAFQGKKRQEKLAAGHAETDTLVLAYSAKIKNLKDQATSLKAKLEKDYPRYYATKYELKTIDVRSIQSKILSPNQTLLEYLVGDSSIFIFVIQKQKYGTVEVKKDFPLEQWVRDMTTNGMAKVKKLNPNASPNYTEAAFRLYEKLIAPVLKANYLLSQELIIIPDGVLGQIPFEALLISKPGTLGNYANYNYLLKQYQISYGYSATLLAQMIEKKHQKAPTATLLAMAPFASSTTSSLKSSQDTTKVRSALSHLRDTLSTLQYSGDEIKTIAQHWAGQLFYNREANLNQFVTQADQYRIIHLATHGKADARAGDYSFLAFHTGTVDSLYDKLYARDLYNMSLNADMVVLSACETGIGQLQRGEGIVSLARAFTFAGTKSIVTTLWAVNDVKTKELMAFFYAELEKLGMRKDAALRNAKLRYLQQFNTEADPFFWAGFIAIGDMTNLR